MMEAQPAWQAAGALPPQLRSRPWQQGAQLMLMADQATIKWS